MRIAANFALYGTIGGLTAAMAWPEQSPITWRFWGGVALAVVINWKALMSKGGDSKPTEAMQTSAKESDDQVHGEV